MTEFKPGEISLIDRAIGFAAREHHNQMRKTGEKIPYIAHPFAVAMILQQMGCREEVVVAGLLHDTVEDTKVGIEDIRSQFGNDVANIVTGCTELPKRSNSWKERKTQMIASLREASIEVKLVAAADKYHNLSHTLASIKTTGPNIWKQFGQGQEQQAWYYRNVYESILANAASQDGCWLFEQLGEVISELFEGIPSRPPSSW